jgi:hypothetical protein
MSNRGVFAIDRGIFDHQIFAPEPYTEREAWIWMIGAAAWKAQRVRVGRHTISLDRGQLAFSTRFLASKFKWSQGKIIRYLKRLETEAMATTSATREATHITICNYDKYAFGRNTNDTQTETQNDALTVHSRFKEEERKEREEESPTIVPLKGDPAGDQPKAQSVAKPKRAEKRKTPWPEGFALNDEMRAFAAERGWGQSRQDTEFEKFHQHALQSDRSLKDWVAGWRTWVLNGIGYDQQRGRPPIALATPASDPTPIDWGGRVEMFKRTNIWPLPWGPQPGSGGCRAPPDVLAQNGFGRAVPPSNGFIRPSIGRSTAPQNRTPEEGIIR